MGQKIMMPYSSTSYFGCCFGGSVDGFLVNQENNTRTWGVLVGTTFKKKKKKTFTDRLFGLPSAI